MPVSLLGCRDSRQKVKLIGPARNRQTNSHLPTGIASSSVKNHISVKKSHSPDPRNLRRQPNLFLRCPSLISQQLPGDGLPLYLGCALIDGQGPDLAVEPFHPVAFLQSCPTVDLYRLVNDAAGGLGAKELGE